MKLNHIYKSIACGVLLAMTATSCDLDYNPVDTYSDEMCIRDRLNYLFRTLEFKSLSLPIYIE